MSTNSLQSKPSKELFIISDLHIGGEYPGESDDQGFRMNTHVDDLIEFINEVTERYQQKQIPTELIINGDFIDFLAEKIPDIGIRKSFINNEQHALNTFNQIVERDQELFSTLNKMLSAGVNLTILLGNHDVELSFPRVRARIHELLGVEKNNRLQFIFDGEAYVVGNVLIEHGNRYDGWNTIDHDRLRRFRSETSRRLEISNDAQFLPPAGSRLVEKIMNIIKKDYPFIDLLKPETEAAIPLLLALEPSYGSMANGIETYHLEKEAKKHSPVAPARPALSGDIAAEKTDNLPDNLVELLSRQLRPSDRENLEKLIIDAKKIPGEIAALTIDRVLTFIKLRMDDSYDSRLKTLHGTLKCLQDDKSFDFTTEAELSYSNAAKELRNKGFQAIIFGHTHLAKEVKLTENSDYPKYLNTGTWANLLEIPKNIISGPESLAFEDLKKFATAIQLKKMDSFIKFIPTFAHIAFMDMKRLTSANIHVYKHGMVKVL